MLILIMLMLLKNYLIIVFGFLLITGCMMQVEKPRESITIFVKDSLTNSPIEGVEIKFAVMCYSNNIDFDNDPTCGGKYEKINAKTDSKGIFVYKPSEKTPDIYDFLYFLVEKEGHYKDEWSHVTSDFDGDGIVEVKMIPLTASILKEKAIEIAKSDSRVKKWLSKVKDFNELVSIFEGYWIINFTWNTENKEDIARLTVSIDPETGNIIDYGESNSVGQS